MRVCVFFTDQVSDGPRIERTMGRKRKSGTWRKQIQRLVLVRKSSTDFSNI